MIHDSDSKFAKACFLLSHISSLSLYRGELEGIFWSLKHIETLTGIYYGSKEHIFFVLTARTDGWDDDAFTEISWSIIRAVR